MMNYIYVDGERIELATKHTYQIYLNGKFVVGADKDFQNFVNTFTIIRTLRALGISFKIKKCKKDNIIDGYLEVRNIITQDQ